MWTLWVVTELCHGLGLRITLRCSPCRPSFEERKRLGLAHRRKGGNFKSKSR